MGLNSYPLVGQQGYENFSVNSNRDYSGLSLVGWLVGWSVGRPLGLRPVNRVRRANAGLGASLNPGLFPCIMNRTG